MIPELSRILFDRGVRFLAQSDGSFWMPRRGSTTAEQVDWLFYFILWVSVFFFVLVVAWMLFFIFRYRRRKAGRAEGGPHQNLALELTWTLVPLVIVIIIFSIGFAGFMNMTRTPENALEILVTGQKWIWLFTYPNGHVDEELHVPVDEPIGLVMTSEDVIHSFYVPDFRLKRDVLPGRYSKTWFRATEPGEYKVYCAEYCGTGHSDMIASIIVHPPGEYEKWLESAGQLADDLSPAELGARLYSKRGCDQCHSVDGTAGIGPSLLSLSGKQRPLKDGTVVLADENYLRESIMEPMTKIVAGYEAYMPTYKGRLKDREITGLIEYIKSLEGEDSQE